MAEELTPPGPFMNMGQFYINAFAAGVGMNLKQRQLEEKLSQLQAQAEHYRTMQAVAEERIAAETAWHNKEYASKDIDYKTKALRLERLSNAMDDAAAARDELDAARDIKDPKEKINEIHRIQLKYHNALGTIQGRDMFKSELDDAVRGAKVDEYDQQHGFRQLSQTVDQQVGDQLGRGLKLPMDYFSPETPWEEQYVATQDGGFQADGRTPIKKGEPIAKADALRGNAGMKGYPVGVPSGKSFVNVPTVVDVQGKTYNYNKPVTLDTDFVNKTKQEWAQRMNRWNNRPLQQAEAMGEQPQAFLNDPAINPASVMATRTNAAGLKQAAMAKLAQFKIPVTPDSLRRAMILVAKENNIQLDDAAMPLDENEGPPQPLYQNMQPPSAGPSATPNIMPPTGQPGPGANPSTTGGLTMDPRFRAVSPPDATPIPRPNVPLTPYPQGFGQ